LNRFTPAIEPLLLALASVEVLPALTEPVTAPVATIPPTLRPLTVAVRTWFLVPLQGQGM
jgi:hypothetical protein